MCLRYDYRRKTDGFEYLSPPLAWHDASKLFPVFSAGFESEVGAFSHGPGNADGSVTAGVDNSSLSDIGPGPDSETL